MIGKGLGVGERSKLLIPGELRPKYSIGRGYKLLCGFKCEDPAGEPGLRLD
jgi:hypothetical protein